MADFKIKPAAGTGNKLILESEDGTDVLTTSDSGVTITAPTIADLSNVTGTLPVGVIGGSGLTALGTVTSGNLSNTAIVYPAGHTKITTITNDTETSFSNATSHYETIGSHTKSLASSIITAMVCLPIQANVADGMWTVPILQLQYGGTVSAVQTGGTFGSTGMGPQVILYGTWTGKSAAAHDLKWGWTYGATSSKPGITTWNPDETIDTRMTQSATYAIVMEIFV